MHTNSFTSSAWFSSNQHTWKWSGNQSDASKISRDISGEHRTLTRLNIIISRMKDMGLDQRVKLFECHTLKTLNKVLYKFQSMILLIAQCFGKATTECLRIKFQCCEVV